MKRKILRKILRFLTEKIVNKYDPLIIAVTGSVGKTSTKDAIYTTLKRYKNIRKSSKNFNTDIGAPLVFLGVDDPGKDLKSWLLIIWKGVKLLIKKKKAYPEVIVMEMAADHKGEIEYLTEFIKPHISVVTAIGEIPVHLEFYNDINELIKEKSLIVKNTRKGGAVILNADDGRVFQMKGRAKTGVKTYGLSSRAEIRGNKIKFTGTEDEPRGVKLSVTHGTEEHEILLPNVFDDGSIYSVLASIGVGISMGIPVYRLVESCKGFKPPKGRMRLIKGDGFNIIDSSYNAAPSSTEIALKALKKAPGKRKIAVLGDMLELGNLSTRAHQNIAKKCQFLDILVTIGKDSELIGQALKEEGFEGDVFHYESSKEAAKKMKEIVEANDLILVKGSQSIRAEKVIEELMVGEPKKELVRQYYPWKKDEEN